MDDVFIIEPLSFKAIGVAVLCGLIIGFERQWSGKPAGIRTSILICISAYTFVRLGQFYQPEAGSVRIVGQIVTGVGFLGGGVIMAKDGLVQGVTSAAVIWILAAMGSMIGLGHLVGAIGLSMRSILTLVGITFLEGLMKKLRGGVHGK